MLFFCFKQKTAYEMRISDWSSDVCSSDLIPNSPPTDVKEYVCGGSMYCINGSCSENEEEASNEFKDALVAMGAIDQVGKEFDPDTMWLFKGPRETCHKPGVGYVNRCAGKVSGLFSCGGPAAIGVRGGRGRGWLERSI